MANYKITKLMTKRIIEKEFEKFKIKAYQCKGCDAILYCDHNDEELLIGHLVIIHKPDLMEQFL